MRRRQGIRVGRDAERCCTHLMRAHAFPSATKGKTHTVDLYKNVDHGSEALDLDLPLVSPNKLWTQALCSVAIVS